MKLTREYIMKFRTDRGSWTQPQIEALGIDWPPRHGWIDRLEGKEISDDNRIRFESRLGVKAIRKAGKQFSKQDRLFDDSKQVALKKHAERSAADQLDDEWLESIRHIHWG